MRYRTKAEWAAAKAEELDEKAAAAEKQPPAKPGAHGYAQHRRAIETLQAEAFRFWQMSGSYARRGL